MTFTTALVGACVAAGPALADDNGDTTVTLDPGQSAQVLITPAGCDYQACQTLQTDTDEPTAVAPADVTPPDSSDPTSTDPTSTDPTSTDPTSTDPTSTDPTSTDPTTVAPSPQSSDLSDDDVDNDVAFSRQLKWSVVTGAHFKAVGYPRVRVLARHNNASIEVRTADDSSGVGTETIYIYTYSAQNCSAVPLIGCTLWHFGSTEQWYGQVGLDVWKDNINCNNIGGTGFSVNVQACNFTNPTYAYVPNPIGAINDALISALVKGVPVSNSHSINYQDWADGKVSASYS